jgi:GxxExxY protein
VPIKAREMQRETFESISKQLVNAWYRVHKELGPGLLESVYQYCLLEELRLNGITAAQEVFLPVYYRGKAIGKDFRIDILVEKEIIVEIKAVEILLPVHVAQIISYLKLADKKIGFLMNFNVPVFREGIRRFVNNY